MFDLKIISKKIWVLGIGLAVSFSAGFSHEVDMAKIDSALSRMSRRAKSEISIPQEKKAEFARDFEAVLAEDKRISGPNQSLLFLIDKKHSVSSSFVPPNLVNFTDTPLFNFNKKNLSLRREAYFALEEMSRGSQKDGITLFISSTYRSYEYQRNLFDYWVKVDGLEEAERESARPGTSQHQLGTAVDFGSVSDDFDETRMGKWVYAHAAEYGWSLSFPKNYEDVTGYRWECWHFRFIGKEACRFQKKWFANVQQYMLEFIDFYRN